MHPAQWFYSALVVFFLGLLSIASGGLIVLVQFFSRDAAGPGVLQPLVVSGLLLATLLFVLGGVLALLKPRAPARFPDKDEDSDVED